MAFSFTDNKQWSSLHDIISDCIAREGFDLVDFELKRGRGGFLLRVFMDHAEGIDIDDCARVSQRISNCLDAVDLIPGPYTLEVSSPGLDRPLKKEKDFERFQGKWIKLTFDQASDKRIGIEGRIISFKDHMLTVEARDGEIHDISHDKIIKARLIVDF